jgi:hypothetical protein
MLIIDLDSRNFSVKKPAAPVAKETVTKSAPKPPQNPIVKEVLKPALPEKANEDQKERILRKLDEEERYVRHQRAINHLKFFDHLGPDLTPKKNAEFSEIYEEQRVYRERLKSIYLKRQQLEKTGRIDQPKYFTDSELARLGALKHERSNAYKNISKLKKKVEEAKVKGNPDRATEIEQKLDLMSMKILEMSHEIEKIERNGLVS